MSILLAVDIGNTTIGLGLFKNPGSSNKIIVRKVPSHPARSANEYKKIIEKFINESIGNNSPREIDSIISSVVPRLDRPVTGALKDLCGKGPLILNHKSNTGITFDVPHPEGIGPDRIANAVAGAAYFKKPLAVVDFGTATTLTVVGKHNNFLGGAILPGLGLMLKSLYSETARLPLAPIERPVAILGKDTMSSLASGIVYGTAGAVEMLIKGIEKELHFRLQLILTGGHCKLMSEAIKKDCKIVPDLTFEGLRLVHMRKNTIT